MAQIALLAVGLLASGYSAYQAHEQKQEEKAALRKQEEYQIEELNKKKKFLLAQQKASFAASGISLTGYDDTPSFTFEETKQATATDINRIQDYYNTQIGNANNKARAQYINSLSSAVGSMYSYSAGGASGN